MQTFNVYESTDRKAMSSYSTQSQYTNCVYAAPQL